MSVINDFKALPTSVKVAYYLVTLSLILNVVTLSLGGGNGGGSVGKWIENNPQAVLDSVNNYVRKMQEGQQQQQQGAAKENIAKYRSDLENDKRQAVINPKGKKVIVEFFDYDCPYCRMAAKTTKELLAKRKDIKLILKPLVIHDSAQKATELGIAISLKYPEKFEAYYEAIMVDGQGQSTALIRDAIKKAGLKYEEIEKLAESRTNDINEIIGEARDIAGKMGVNGTPGFIILNSEGELIPGAVDGAQLEQIIDR
ncbi:MAG: hypothetical protein Ta2D_13060 [Rickettsiales bacterium]|nr:MAG: hypothetical protein Ta2D_13060 [Rickettsiales bacterium]